MMKAVLSAIMLATTGASAPHAIGDAVAARGKVVLPLTLRQGFPMVAGSVNGRQGYFMLDTGTPFPVFLNSDYLHLTGGPIEARGSASSGQAIAVHRFGCLDSLRIGRAYTLESICGQKGADLHFVAKELEPRFLGFLGYGLFRSFRVTFDFAGRQATLDDRARPVEDGAVTTFRFAAADGNSPRVTMNAGAVTLSGYMDTGDPGHVTLTRSDADRLTASGDLVRSDDAKGGVRYTLHLVRHDGQALDAADLPVTIAGEKTEIVIGFNLLKHYRSTWDFTAMTVRLYAPGR